MSVTGFWVVGVVPDGDVARLLGQFPGADSFGRRDPEPSGDLEWWSGSGNLEAFFDPGPYGPVPTELALRLQDGLAATGSADEQYEAVKEELLRLVPQHEGVDLFCASTRKGDPVAALHYGLGPEAVFQLPGCFGDFLLDAAGVRATLPGMEAALDLAPGRRRAVEERIRDWLAGMTDGTEHDLNDLVDGPLRVLRHALRHGLGAAGMTLWY
ncbi:hypothetical protein [Streptacidiphilus fuscans]|uniref:Uncharacterized protein n=1 Tax=Streptacidiphilus fuscans TaxID=2789292 RepID=A0A931FHH0_9ACTN|nr:hypothetical protein [Streptacidiphilus fuscans]MBF9072365.1 hypothetical protein [Streptacidiphilus fuscans]